MRLVGADAEADAGARQAFKRVDDARIGSALAHGLLRIALEIAVKESFDIEIVGDPARGFQATDEERSHAIADHGAKSVEIEARATKFGEHLIEIGENVGRRVNEGAVQIEDDGIEALLNFLDPQLHPARLRLAI